MEGMWGKEERLRGGGEGERYVRGDGRREMGVVDRSGGGDG